MSQKRIAWLTALAALALVSHPARGDLVRFDFEGVIESTFGSIGGTPASAFQGFPFSGHVLFDADEPDAAPETSQVGIYSFAVPPHALHAQVGGAIFDAPTLQISVGNDSSVFAGADLYDIGSPAAFPYPGVAGHQISTFSLSFFDAAGAVFADDSLPPLPPALSHFSDPGESRSFTVQGCPDANFSGGTCNSVDFVMSGDVTSFTVPEAGASAAFATAALALAAMASARDGVPRP